MGQQRAGERAKRSALEAELAELSAASKAQSGEGATNARELVRVQRQLFFFQAEDGIRDADVTGVQTCALPICRPARPAENYPLPRPRLPNGSSRDRCSCRQKSSSRLRCSRYGQG